jgi:DNA-binding GntR family transcriptional regulator
VTEQSRRRTYKDVSDALRARVAAGDWAASGRLPGEASLAAEYGVARETLRRALTDLRDEGLISNQQGKAWRLGSDPAGQAPDVLAAAEKLRTGIDDGAYAGQPYFPSETTLASELGISRHKVRLILAELEKSGHLENQRGNGRVVHPGGKENPSA